MRVTGLLWPLISAVCVTVGLGLTIWARQRQERWHLARNWSGVVTLKEDHALVRTDPYRSVRHPIYSGLLLALIGRALAIGQWRGVLAVACAMIAFLWNIRVEEANIGAPSRNTRRSANGAQR